MLTCKKCEKKLNPVCIGKLSTVAPIGNPTSEPSLQGISRLRKNEQEKMFSAVEKADFWKDIMRDLSKVAHGKKAKSLEASVHDDKLKVQFLAGLLNIYLLQPQEVSWEEIKSFWQASFEPWAIFKVAVSNSTKYKSFDKWKKYAWYRSTNAAVVFDALTHNNENFPKNGKSRFQELYKETLRSMCVYMLTQPFKIPENQNLTVMDLKDFLVKDKHFKDLLAWLKDRREVKQLTTFLHSSLTTTMEEAKKFYDNLQECSLEHFPEYYTNHCDSYTSRLDSWITYFGVEPRHVNPKTKAQFWFGVAFMFAMNTEALDKTSKIKEFQTACDQFKSIFQPDKEPLQPYMKGLVENFIPFLRNKHYTDTEKSLLQIIEEKLKQIVWRAVYSGANDVYEESSPEGVSEEPFYKWHVNERTSYDIFKEFYYSRALSNLNQNLNAALTELPKSFDSKLKMEGVTKPSTIDQTKGPGRPYERRLQRRDDEYKRLEKIKQHNNWYFRNILLGFAALAFIGSTAKTVRDVVYNNRVQFHSTSDGSESFSSTSGSDKINTESEKNNKSSFSRYSTKKQKPTSPWNNGDSDYSTLYERAKEKIAEKADKEKENRVRRVDTDLLEKLYNLKNNIKTTNKKTKNELIKKITERIIKISKELEDDKDALAYEPDEIVEKTYKDTAIQFSIKTPPEIYAKTMRFLSTQMHPDKIKIDDSKKIATTWQQNVPIKQDRKNGFTQDEINDFEKRTESDKQVEESDNRSWDDLTETEKLIFWVQQLTLEEGPEKAQNQLHTYLSKVDRYSPSDCMSLQDNVESFLQEHPGSQYYEFAIIYESTSRRLVAEQYVRRILKIREQKGVEEAEKSVKGTLKNFSNTEAYKYFRKAILTFLDDRQLSQGIDSEAFRRIWEPADQQYRSRRWFP